MACVMTHPHPEEVDETFGNPTLSSELEAVEPYMYDSRPNVSVAMELAHMVPTFCSLKTPSAVSASNFSMHSETLLHVELR